MLPSVMRACMEYLGDDVGLPDFQTKRGGWQWSTCALIHGVTGSCFMFALSEHGNSAGTGPRLMDQYDHAFSVAGYAYEPLLRTEFAATLAYDGARSDDADEFRRRIVASIDNKRPVIALGVIGPAEPCLICGYEESGRTLVGWSYFQGEARADERVSFDAAGRFRKHDWFIDTLGIILIGGRRERPPREQVYRDGLRRGLATLCRTTSSGGTPLGLRAYQAWMRRLLEPLPEDVAASLGRLGSPHEKHDMNVGELAERRAYAGTFLEHAAEALPAAGPMLMKASRCFDSIHDMMWRVWQTIGPWNSTTDEKLLNFGQQSYRRELASVVRRSQAWELDAIRLIREALLADGAAPAELAPTTSLEPLPGLRDMGVERPLPTALDGPRWEGGNNALRNIGVFQAAADSPTDLAAAVALASTSTPSPIAPPTGTVQDLSRWGSSAGWRLRIEKADPAEQSGSVPYVQRLTDVVVSVLHGLPVVTTWQGRAAVVVGYPHLSRQALELREPGAAADAPPTVVQYGDAKLGPTWIFLDARTGG
jgi:hypothetical protein